MWSRIGGLFPYKEEVGGSSPSTPTGESPCRVRETYTGQGLPPFHTTGRSFVWLRLFSPLFVWFVARLWTPCGHPKAARHPSSRDHNRVPWIFAGHRTTKEDLTLAKDNGDLYDEDVFALVDRTIESLEEMRAIIL